jgi:hypothetical protein
MLICHWMQPSNSTTYKLYQVHLTTITIPVNN